LAALIFFLSGCSKQEQAGLSLRDNMSQFGARLLGEMPDRAWNDAKHVFCEPNNLIPLAIAGGASIAMHNFDADRNLNENFQRHRGFNDAADKAFDFAGHPGTHLAAAGIWYLASAADYDAVNQERAWTTLSALVVTDASTLALKLASDTDRPNGDGYAFPSGHTASSFCIASCLDEFYGPKIGVPAYIGACFVGWRMVDSEEHWASDVLFGGTLGFIIGHSVAANQNIQIAGFQIVPTLATTYTPASGISLIRRF
jgi:membrane-associated phospholipid phosphatase